MTDFTLLYCDIILKKIVVKLSKDIKAKNKAQATKCENALNGSVRTQRHWKAAANNEFYIAEVEESIKRMKELDYLTNWTSKVYQDRFKFLEKYPEAIKAFEIVTGVELEGFKNV